MEIPGLETLGTVFNSPISGILKCDIFEHHCLVLLNKEAHASIILKLIMLRGLTAGGMASIVTKQHPVSNRRNVASPLLQMLHLEYGDRSF